MKRQALAAAAITALTWGLTGIFVVLLPRVSAFYIAGGRLLVGFLCVLPWLLFSAQARTTLRSAATRPVAYLFAALLSAYYLFATSAFQHAAVAEVALLLCLAPLFVLFLRRLRGDVPNRRELLGAIISLAGLSWLLAPRLMAASTATHHLLGDLLAIAAAACTAIYADRYACLQRKAIAPNPLGTTLLTLIFGSGVLLPLGWLSEAWPVEALQQAEVRWHLLGLGALCTGIPSLTFAFASRHLPPLVTATISLLIPVFAALFAALVLEQTLPASMLPGSLVLLGGVALVLRASHVSSRG